MTLLQGLKKYFGYDAFRPGQKELCSAVMSGRDALCVMPTGAGKSLCYQLPALVMPGITLVVSPLIALMKDQVAALARIGVRAAYINSSLSYPQYLKALSLMRAGAFKIVYVAPERLELDGFRAAAAGMDISFVAVDEAHCVSQWGQDFRKSYLGIRDFIASLPSRPAVGAYTATATKKVSEDIVSLLGLSSPLTETAGFDRPNLYFSVRRPRSKNDELISLLQAYAGRCGIVYCATRKAVDQVCALINGRGLRAVRYHAGLDDGERAENQDAFVGDRVPLIVATNAFGMGIDKPDVSFVIHYNMPKDIESYYQEAGRAGRDGARADCVLLYSPADVQTALFLIDSPDVSPEQAEKDRARLAEMKKYCLSNTCLRSFILRYFGETAPGSCGFCSVCSEKYTDCDITGDAVTLLSCVASAGECCGLTTVADILRGSANARILARGLTSASGYGSFKKKSAADVRALIDELICQELLVQTSDKYPVLRLGGSAAEVMRGERPVTMRKPESIRAAADPKPDDGLFSALRELRRSIAAEERVPPYIIFYDSTLRDMCEKRPRTASEMLRVSGVGEVKLKKYGGRFLDALAAYGE